MASVVVNNPIVLSPSLSTPTATTTDSSDFLDFEFLRLDDPPTTIPADQLFSNGQLLPLNLPKSSPPSDDPPCRRPFSPSAAVAVPGDPNFFSPRAPTCTGHLLNLRRFLKPKRALNLQPNQNPNPKSLKQILRPKSDDSLPLLSSPPESLSCPLDRPRFSLDDHHVPRVRLVRPIPENPQRTGRSPRRRASEAPPPPRGASVDSPRMNSSGKIVYQGLERSSSHPGSVRPPGSRPRVRGMDRSYSVINVPVCSLRGSSSVFSNLFASPAGSVAKKDGSGLTGSGSSVSRTSSKTRTERV